MEPACGYFSCLCSSSSTQFSAAEHEKPAATSVVNAGTLNPKVSGLALAALTSGSMLAGTSASMDLWLMGRVFYMEVCIQSLACPPLGFASHHLFATAVMTMWMQIMCENVSLYDSCLIVVWATCSRPSSIRAYVNLWLRRFSSSEESWYLLDSGASAKCFPLDSGLCARVSCPST